MESESPGSLTFLEFGSINLKSQSKSIWDFRLHQEAYDFFMLARYMKDLMIFRKLAAGDESPDEGLAKYQAGVYTRDLYNSFTKLAALHTVATAGPPIFLELGSTLMGCIDALRYLQKLGAGGDSCFSSLDLQTVDWRGIDISELLNDVAAAIYPEYRISTYLNHRAYQGTADVFFAKGVSLLYAFEDAEDMAQYLTRSRISIFDYSFATAKSQQEILGTGKPVVYLALPEVLRALNSCGAPGSLYFETKTLSHDREKGRIRTLCYYGSADDINALIAEETRLRDAVARQLSNAAHRSLLQYGAADSLTVGLATDILKGLEP